MDDAWQAKAAPTWRSQPPPPTQLPPPTVAAPVTGSSNQVDENALPIFRSFVAQEARLQEHSMVQESLFLNSQNVGRHRLGKTELDNSVLPLLSGHAHNLSSDFLHSLSSTSGEPTFHAQGDGATICGTNISVTGISTSEIYEKSASGKGKAYPFVSSRPLFVSTRNRPSVLHNSTQVGDYCYLGSDSAQPVLHQVIQAHDKRLPVSSMKRSWHNVSNTVDTSLQHTLHNQKFKKMPVEVMSASSGHASSISSGRPRVFCLNTVGELFVNERGCLGVICFCHNLNMSVAKFCEHSGSSASNPGGAVCMENGITLSQWCKLSFGLRARGDNYEWDLPVSSSARGGYRLHHNNFSYLSKNPGTSQSIESFMSARSGEPWNNSAHYNNGAAGPYAFEKSTDCVKNNAHQWNVSNQSDFLRCSSSPLQSVTPALANNHSMLAMKGSPIMVSFGALNTKANNGAQSVGHELVGDSVNNTNRWGNHSIMYPCVDAKKSSNQNYSNSWGNFSSKQIVEGGNGSSNTELRLGQPSQNKAAFFGSFPVTKHPHQSMEMLDSQRQQLCKPLTHGTICPRETNKPRPNVQCTVPEPSTLDRRSLLQASSNNNASSSSEAEGAVVYAAKNSAISLFLSHLNYIEENDLSKFTDNILNEAENIMTSEPDDDSLSNKCSLPDSFRVITDATKMNSTIHESEIFDSIEKRKGLRIAERSPYNVSNPSYFVENKQTTVSEALPSIITSNYPHEASLDDSTSTMYLHQEFGPNAWNNKEYEEVPFLGKCGRRGQLTCRAVNSVPYSSARSCSCNTNAPKNLTSVSLVFGPEATLGLLNLSDRDKTQHLMDENLGCHALRCTVDLCKQEKLSPSLETSHQHGRMCCLSSADLQRSPCKGDLIKHGELRVVPHCNFQQNASEIAARSVYSCSLCNCNGCCKSTAACTDKCLRCTATEQRIAVCSKKHDIQLPGCHICHSDPKTLLRLGRVSSSSAVDGVNHEMCNQKEQGSYFPGKCSCTVLSSCLTGCCVCGNNPSYVCTELGFIGKDINVTLPSDNDRILKDNRIENFGCSKCHSMKNEFQAALWRDVPNKVTLHSDAVLITKPARLLGVTEVIDQPAETAAKRFDTTCPEPELAKEQEMSNAYSESSAPVITEVSIERNKVDVCSAEVRNPKSVLELTVDEGSGIEKCGSSDEPLENREWKEALSFANIVDSFGPCGEHKLKNTSKVKDRKIPLSTRCMDQEEVNHLMQQQRKVCTAEKMRGPMKWKSLDASIPLSYLSTEKSDSSNSIDHPLPCKEVKTLLQTDKRIKRKRSVIPSKSLNLQKSENHQKFCENGEAQSSGDCALKVTKLSTLVTINQDFHVDGSKQPVIQVDKKGITGKPPKYKSLGCFKKIPNHGADTCDGKVRPVVSGNSGIISDVRGSQQKPPKMVSLSVILKTAQRCCISENEAIPGLLSTSETKKARLNANTRSCSALSSMRKGENGGCSISLRNRKQSSFLLMPSINKSCSNSDDRCADEVSIMKRETHCGISRTSRRGNFHGFVESQPRFEETRKRSVSELTGGDRHAAKSMCILRHGENSSVTEGGSVLKTYSSTCTQKNLVGRISCCENLLDKPPSNIQLSNDCQAYQDHEPCQINRRSSKRRRCQPFIFDSDAFCCVCGSSNKEQGNYLLECNDCLIRVHQACYGVPKAPKGGWYCRPCKTNSKNIVCVLCGYEGGAMTRAIKSQNIVKSLLKAWSGDIEQKYMKAISTFKLSFDKFPEQSCIGETSDCQESSSVLPVGSATRGDFQRDTPKMDLQSLPNFVKIPGNSIIAGVLDSSVIQWVHMVCGLWTPGTRCPNVDTMSAFDVSGASSRKNGVCSICNRPGGSSICCRIPNCSVRFHPWCAHQKGLLQSEIEGVNNEKVGFYGRCMVHAAHNSSVVGCPVDAEVESPRQRDYNCARIEGYKGRRRDEGHRANFQNPYNDSGGCIVSQDQINAWIHINGQKSCARGVVKPACSDVESDFRKEYMRYKQAKGWRHLVVYKSGIHGLGLYTSQFIARGAMVVEYVGEIVGLRVADKREIEYQSGRKIQYKSACYFFRIDKEHIIDATRKGGIARFVNHSCLPNCVAKVISIRNEKKVVFFAERDINPGEEITYDYHFNHEDECQKIPCFCNSRNCRRYLN